MPCGDHVARLQGRSQPDFDADIAVDPMGAVLAQRGDEAPAPAKAIAVDLRHEASGRRHQLYHVVHEADLNLESRRRRPMRVPLRPMVHHPRPWLYRMRATHRRPPYLRQRQKFTDQSRKES